MCNISARVHYVITIVVSGAVSGSLVSACNSPYLSSSRYALLVDSDAVFSACPLSGVFPVPRDGSDGASDCPVYIEMGCQDESSVSVTRCGESGESAGLSPLVSLADFFVKYNPKIPLAHYYIIIRNAFRRVYAVYFHMTCRRNFSNLLIEWGTALPNTSGTNLRNKPLEQTSGTNLRNKHKCPKTGIIPPSRIQDSGRQYGANIQQYFVK